MLKYLRESNIEGKTVIVRFDYNVTILDGKILSTKKIDASFETLDYLVSKNCKIIILSHFGRVKNEDDLNSNSLKPVFEYIKFLNKYNIRFVEECMGTKLQEAISELKPGEVILVENTRFLDLKGNLESGCDIQLSMYWAGLADFYVDDAFASMHRNHASVTGIPQFLPSAIGFLVEKEIDNLSPIINTPNKPFIVVMGGAKLEDKIKLIYSLIEKADYILLGGGIANTFLRAAGFRVGSSLVSSDSLETAKMILQEYPDKIILPKDVITSPTYSKTTYDLKKVDDIDIDDIIGDIGSAAIENYKRILLMAKTIFVNGTVGMYEEKQFANGTRELLDIISKSDALKIVGGGDAVSAVTKFGYENKMDFLSTGGGATLKYIVEGTLPGIIAIENSPENKED